MSTTGVQEESDCNNEYRRAHSVQLSVSSEPIVHENRELTNLYHGTWPVERTMWNSEPLNVGPQSTTEMTSVMSFASSSGGAPLDRVLSSPNRSRRSSQHLEAKVDMVYSLLSMLGGQEHADMGETLLALSSSPESCLAMRQSGCIPLLVQLVQSDKDADTRKKASQALNNLVSSNTDEKLRKRETRVLKLLEQMRLYIDYLQNRNDVRLESLPVSEDGDRHPVQTIAHLMKLSFDEGHRQAICQLGGICTLANLIETEHILHGSITEEGHCVLLRRYSCMALTNLTFGDSGNKALLCSFKEFMRALVTQLHNPCDELRQVTASVLRNLSWRADGTSKEILREVGAVSSLMKAAMIDNKENTLKSILSALWNLSAHCTENKSELCAVEGALGFLVNMLTYKSSTKSLAIIENAGGILRNISSQIAIRDDYRELLRSHNCLQILLDQLKSSSLTVVSNACGTLWNLSAKNEKDQELLWKMGAPAMLRSLNHSKHKMIAMGSSAALKNLLASRPTHNLLPPTDATAKALDLPILPTLGARKQKALFQELEQSLSETFDNTDKESPTKATDNDNFIVESDSGISQKSQKTKLLLHSDTQKITTAFTSLSISEPSTSYQNRTRLSQSRYGSTSLPYVKPNLSYMSLQKYPDLPYEEESTNYNSHKSNVIDEKNFGIYTETDLDQPTDYSLRYAEDDSEPDEICENVVKTERTDFVQDTVKTYCTEDTPYETPFNYSSATSLTDLRKNSLDLDKQVATCTIDNDKLAKSNNILKNHSMSQSDEKDRCSIEDASEIENVVKSSEKSKSQFSSGIESPEKPVNYADEGTPGYFSRVSSFGSLNSIPAGEKTKEELHVKEEEVNVFDSESLLQKMQVPSEAGKAVKFEQVVNYAEETPLMFSRSSSLASLDSIEQHSIHDDRESVISDFSRLTSGIVSPSELPDSPTQTVPSSPRQRKIPDVSTTSQVTLATHRSPSDSNHQLKPPLKISVFEDNVKKFKEESTPIQFSTATSLSSLTIDDDTKLPEQQCQDQQEHKNYQTEGINQNKNVLNDDTVAVSESEEDEDILAACISEGMQNNGHQSKLTSPLMYKFSSKAFGCSSKSGIQQTKVGTKSNIVVNNELQTSIHSDSCYNYCIDNAKYGESNSGLLTTSNIKKDDKVYSSDESSNLSGDNENILAECIQSAMPKTRKAIKSSLPARSLSGLPVRNIQTSTPIKPFSIVEQNCSRNEPAKSSVPMYLGAKDEVESYAVENSPCQFSLHSSLSDLTIDGSIAGASLRSNPALLSSRSTNEVKRLDSTTRECSLIHAGEIDQAAVVSRHDSLSSLSADSVGSLEQEQALLEQCISSGMPKSRNIPLDVNKSVIKPIGVATKQFNKCKSRPVTDKEHGEVRLKKHKDKSKDCYEGEEKIQNSKNVNVTSAAMSIKMEERVISPIISTMAVDVIINEKVEDELRCSAITLQMEVNISQDKDMSFEESVSTALTKNGCEESDLVIPNSKSSSFESDFTDIINEKNINLEFDNIEGSKNTVDTRMLDPDAMIESLDRFTAELVSQAEAAHSNKDSRKFTTSVTEGDTWNDDSSPNDLTFPSISGSAPNVITFQSELKDFELGNHQITEEQTPPDVCDYQEQPSNDFSSINSSTMTESTLIAVEATKIATVFKNEADMSQSITSLQSLELDCIQPPSHMNSLTNSINGFDSQATKNSTKLVSKKKLLQAGLLARKALTNSLNQTLSLESLDNQSWSNLDHVNPPSIMGEILDMVDLDGSIASVASLTSEVFDIKPEFTSDQQNCIFPVEQSSNLFETQITSGNLESINPPSLFNEITDLCNSLADIATETITSNTELFEDCNTHLNEDEDITLYSEAQCVTPLQSDLTSSVEISPKKVKTLSKQMTPKQKRKLVQERYRTYTVAAEMIVSAELSSLNGSELEYKTVSEDNVSKKLSPKEKRINDKARFETQVLTEAVTSNLQKIDDEPKNSESGLCSQKTKLSIRRNFMQKRLENKDRFKTRVICESSLSPDLSSSSPTFNNVNDLECFVEREANNVLRNLQESKLISEELLDCETLSLISNDDDSERNSGSPINYRTYTKNCTTRTHCLPSIAQPSSSVDLETGEQSEGELTSSPKPKIIKPPEKKHIDIVEQENKEVKSIRGRRKLLYSKTNSNCPRPTTKSTTTRPVRNITSSLVKNVTSVIKSGGSLKNNTGVPTKISTNKPPKHVSPNQLTFNKTSTVCAKPTSSGISIVSENHVQSKANTTKANISAPLERQGTFTRDEESQQNKSRIPTPLSNLPKPTSTSRIARAISHNNSAIGKTTVKVQNVIVPKAASTDRSPNLKPSSGFNRSSSADSRDSQAKRQNSTSGQSLKNQKGAIKRSSLTNISQRCNSNSSITSNGSTSKKQVTSKIASLWKKVEQQKRLVPKEDTRVWIEKDRQLEPPRLLRSGVFDNKEKGTLSNENGNVANRSNLVRYKK
ncbi:hypothetical protein FQA39_LY07406 [Lamprigera yunnana]|nr:hypothetical protein FQA39_LY07406 [Lamprigera yunnana]